LGSCVVDLMFDPQLLAMLGSCVVDLMFDPQSIQIKN